MPNTSTTSKPAPPRKLTLEVAAFNWRSARVQFALGFSLVLIFTALLFQEFFATRFLLSEYMNIGNLLATTDPANTVRSSIPFTTDPITSVQVLLFEHHSWLYRVATFVVAAATALVIGLIQFDTILRFGNRTGAGAAIFSTLLYMTMPFGNSLSLPTTALPVLLSQLAGLCAVYLDMRARFLKETPFLYAALIALLLSGVLDAHGVAIAITGIICQRVMLPDTDRISTAGGQPERSLLRSIPFLYLLVGLAYFVPICIGRNWAPETLDLSQLSISDDTGGLIPYRLFHKIMPPLIVTVFGIGLVRTTIGSVWLRALFFPVAWLIGLFLLGPTLGGFTAENPSMLFFAPPICMILASAALPCIDTINRRMRVAMTIVGCLVLSAIVVISGSVSAHTLHQQCVEARDLSFFKVELARHFASTGGRLVVVNPPFSKSNRETSEFVRDDSTKGLAQALSRLRDQDTIAYQCLLNSPISNQKSQVTTLRKIPSAFVRLAHEATAREDDRSSKVTDYFAWDKDARQLMPIYYVGSDALRLDLTDSATVEKLQSSPSVVRVKDKEWAEIPRGKAFLEIEEKGIRMNSGQSEDLSVWFSHQALDPTKIGRVVVKSETSPISSELGVFLLFKGTEDDDIGAIPLSRAGDALIAETRGISEWHKHKSIVAVGIKLSAGSPAVVLSSLEGAAGRKNHGH